MWAKRHVGDLMWFIPNTVGSFWGGWHNPTKVLQLLLPLNPGKSIFISPALNEYTSLLFLFFLKTVNLFIDWLPVSLLQTQ